MSSLVEAVRKETVEGIGTLESYGNVTCDVCIQGKMSRTTFPKNSERRSEIMDLLHSD